MTLTSKKSVNGFINYGLRVMQSNPYHYFHQTLSFPTPITDAKTAKGIYFKFIKSVLKFYKSDDLAVFYKQERRSKDQTIHFHVCFLFYKQSCRPSTFLKDFRADVFKRWSNHATQGDSRPVHDANKLKEHDFSMKSIMYFTSSVVIDDKSKRPETNWWGVFNKKLITNCSVEPTKEQTKEAFSKLFKKPSRRHRSGQHNLLRRVLGDARIPDFVKNYARRGNYLPLIAYSKSNVPIWPQFNKDSE